MGSLESGDDESSIEMHMGVESECSDTDLSDSSGWETEDEQEVSGEKTYVGCVLCRFVFHKR